MARLLDKIIVVDVEATCWEGQPPPGQDNEIIEIGVAVVDVDSHARVDKRSILVKPERSTVSPFCTNLTTLTQEQVDQGISFKEACNLLKREYLTKDRVWASYGDYDRRQFERQCSLTGVAYPFGPGHLNVKSLFAVLHALDKEVGMHEALTLLGLPLEGVHHRGDDDAWNISHIMGIILARWSHE